MNTVFAYIGMGSNMGDPPKNIVRALDAMRGRGLNITAVSHVYLTEPQGIENSPWFSNCVAQIQCPADMSPVALLNTLLDIEAKLGRVRDLNLHNGPRIIDLDLLLFGDVQSCTEHLILPHPRMAKRAFVLVPLTEIAPEVIIPLPIAKRAVDVLNDLTYKLDGDIILQ